MPSPDCGPASAGSFPAPADCRVVVYEQDVDLLFPLFHSGKASHRPAFSFSILDLSFVIFHLSLLELRDGRNNKRNTENEKMQTPQIFARSLKRGPLCSGGSTQIRKT